MVPEAEKQARISQSWKARGHCSPSPRDSVCPQTVSGWPTVSPTSSWDPGQPSSAGRVTAWVQLPWGNACPPGTLPSQLSRSPSSLALGDAWRPWGMHARAGLRQPRVVQPLRTPNTCRWHLQCPSLSTAQLSKWAQMRGHPHPLISGQRADTEERLGSRGGPRAQSSDGGASLEAAGATE